MLFPSIWKELKAMSTLEERAAERFQIISPLLDEGLDARQLSAKKNEVAAASKVSRRTLERWHKAYAEKGFAGLMPKSSTPQKAHASEEQMQEILSAAITLRRECPTRSVRDIIRILELEGAITEGSVPRSTLQRRLQKSGFGMRQMRMYRTMSPAARRFQKQHRCALYQGDIKYGPYLPIGPGGKPVQTFMAAWIDDATRFVVSARFYDSQKVGIIEDSLRRAIMGCGLPEAVYVDNGRQYRSEWLKKACSRLGIRLVHARPYHPEAKGKIERLNRSVDSFLAECALAKPRSLEELNQLFEAWLREKYHKDAHRGLEGISPETAWLTDSHPLRFPDLPALQEAFLHTETRSVDKTGCISFNGSPYEVGMKLIGRKVEVLYDPTWTEEVEIHHPDFAPFKAKRLTIGEDCSHRKEMPDAVRISVDHSRMLDALKAKAQKAKTSKGHATDFSGMAREVAKHV